MEILLLPVLIGSGPITEAVLKETRSLKVGQLFIVGNEHTEDRIIRELLQIYPGQLLNLDEIRKAEQRLIESGHFVVDEENNIRPTITVLNDSPGIFRDVLVQVKERPEQRPSLPMMLLLISMAGLMITFAVLTWRTVQSARKKL